MKTPPKKRCNLAIPLLKSVKRRKRRLAQVETQEASTATSPLVYTAGLLPKGFHILILPLAPVRIYFTLSPDIKAQAHGLDHPLP